MTTEAKHVSVLLNECIENLNIKPGHIDGEVWHLDVGSSHPGAEVGPKGWAVRPLKRHASWVQNVVSPFIHISN